MGANSSPDSSIVVADYSADYKPGDIDIPSKTEVKTPAKTRTGRAASAKTKLNRTASKAKQKAKQKAAQSDFQQKVRAKVKTRAAKVNPQARQNLSSLAFGLATGLIVLLIFMFSFFNQIVITPFIRPAAASAAPIIVDQNSLAADDTTKVIIPKINVDIPVIYDIDTTSESVIQNNLEDGVIHYPTTEVPGQKGNAAFFGHSSNNIFNPGKYKFAFVLLHTLKTGDIFYLTYNHKVYGYKVIDRKIVEPTDTYVLDDVPGQTATATLITCDPPGTSLHRLVVVGQQISPNPAGNSTSSTKDQPTQQPTHITDNGPSLWSRIWNSVF
jgi:sortase A